MSTALLSIAELTATIAAALETAGTAPANAGHVAAALAAAEVDGQKGHGLSRVTSYAAQVRAGKVDGRAVPHATRPRPGLLQVDAAHGFAFPAFDVAVGALPDLARAQGIAGAAIVRSHHAGALGLVVERLAEAGCVGLMLANTPSAMAAWGGRRAVMGTNPIAFAWPSRSGPPLVIDLALSGVARGRIMAAAQRGEAIPAGWAVDADGRPTTDENAALAGTLLPAGGAKGAALALMVELLAVGLTGQALAFEATSFLDAEGGPPGVGQLIVAIDAAAFAGGEVARDRLATLAETIADDGDARLPGTRRLALRDKARRDGVTVDAKLLAEVRAMGAP